MTNQLTVKNEKLARKLNELMHEEGVDISVGDIYISEHKSERIIKISKIEIYRGSLHIDTDCLKGWDGKEWRHYSGMDARNFSADGSYKKLDKPFNEYLAEAAAVINGDITIEELSIKESQTDETNTALISKSSKEGLIAIQNDMEIKKSRVEMIKAFVGLEMEKRKSELDKVRRKLEGVLTVFNKQIKKIMRVITTIELYLGIDEEIFQIQEGEKAPEDTPISFRQMVLYMDEEVADTEEGGMDFQDIEKFDEWLLLNGNYKKLLPEIKGVLVFRPRRYDKEYANPAENAEMNMLNRITYLFIRNGDCLYRIYSDKIKIQPRLFPKKHELMEMLDKIKNDNSYFSKERAEEEFEDSMYQYKKRAVLLQGLVDRTEILHPMPPKLSIFNMDAAKGMFNFIYDDEASLPDGRLSFWEWVKESNKKIEHGSRIVLTGEYGRYGEKDSDRIFRYMHESNLPPNPNKGVYEVERFMEKGRMRAYSDNISKYKDDTEKYPNFKVFNEYKNRGGDMMSEFTYDIAEHLTIRHNPKDRVYGGWGSYEASERKNKIRWKIYADDAFVLNYDQISLSDINFYLENRTDRKNYLKMMPLLRELKKWRLIELANEREFVKMVVQVVCSEKVIDPDFLEVKVWDAVAWWKFKNQIKRPIDKDDSKALRMIKKKIFSDIKKEGKL